MENLDIILLTLIVSILYGAFAFTFLKFTRSPTTESELKDSVIK